MMRKLVFFALALFLAAAAVQAEETPLLQPGKTTLYERVLTRPGARVARDRIDIGKQNNPLLRAFSQLYVYERTSIDGRNWLRVGKDAKGSNDSIVGWVSEDTTVPWKQQLTLAFTNPGTVRDRLLFFKSRSSLEDILKSPRPADLTRPIIRRIEQSGKDEQGGKDERVLALEPEKYVDVTERFYLLPVLEHVQTLSATGESVRLLKVASISESEAGARPPRDLRLTASAPGPRLEPARQYRAAVCFVIDSTISMGPYIDDTNDAISKVYERLRNANVIDRVRFGLVAFRAKTGDDMRDRALAYDAQLFVDPLRVSDTRSFLDHVKELREATVSTNYFDEDALKGVLTSLDRINWDEFDARFIVLITDAGALDGSMVRPGGPRVESTTGLDVQRVASIAGEKQVAITVFHLKTSAGADDHDRAEGQYRMLARNSRFQTEAYLPIEAGSRPEFRRAVDALTQAIIANVRDTNQTPDSSDGSENRPVVDTANALSEDNPYADVISALGHAMRLNYLGDLADTRTPTLFEAWISDRDFADPTKETVEVRVLLTKYQLSDLQMMLQRIVNAAEQGMIKPLDFYDTLRFLAAQFGRDPSLAINRRATRLADLELLGEYLDDLPYQSEVMALSQDTWTTWGPEKQLEFVNTLKRKLRQYARYNEDWRGWVNLAQTADGTGESVYPIPLQDMP